MRWVASKRVGEYLHHCVSVVLGVRDLTMVFRAALSVATAPESPRTSVAVRVLGEPHMCIHVWWSLPDVWSLLTGGGVKSYSDTRGKRWPRWLAYVKEADVGDRDMLGSALSLESGSAAGASPRAERCEYPFAAVSTRALLLLISRWASADQLTGRIDEIAAACHSFLRWLLRGVATPWWSQQ